MSARRPPRFGGTVVFLVLLTAACATSPSGGPEGWSRSFARPFDEVWAAAETALADEGFEVVGSDREKGRIRAESAAAALELRVVARGEIVVVDVMGAGTAAAPVAMRELGDRIEAFLGELSRALREG